MARGPQLQAVLFDFRSSLPCPYFAPELMWSAQTFDLRPGEKVLVLFNTRDSVMRFRTCCRAVDDSLYEQLCVQLENVSETETVSVTPDTPLSRLMSDPRIYPRLTAGCMDSVTLLLVRNKKPSPDDDAPLPSLAQMHLN